MRRVALLGALLAAACSLRPYELVGDGGPGDGGGGDGDGATGIPDGGELGDGPSDRRGPWSDACAADLANDPGNCGECGHVCSFPNALPRCQDGACVLGDCLPGFWNRNGLIADGCEYACTVTNGGVELCDNLDNDCNGLTDEATDKQIDLNNCGACGTRCLFLHAAASCQAGVCVLGACDPGWVDANHLPLDGCECQITNGGVETCDGLDNDCNGITDDVPASTLQTDPQHCGACARNCVALPHAAGDCQSGHCVVLGCEYGYYDVDGLPDNGCEVHCPYGAPGAPEVCDGIDNNCDGVIDADGPDGPLAGRPDPATFCRQLGACAGAVPVCRGGRWICNYGPDVELSAPGEVAPEETRCDGIDNDCDGCIDESFPQVGLKPTPNGGTCAVTAPQPCVDSGIGACQGRGHFACNVAGTGIACLVTQPGAAPSPEVCDGSDNDCDGIVDNATGPNRVVDPMVAVSGGGLPGTVWIYAYEAARPDATALSAGAATARACARAGVLPWTNVTYSQAGDACAAAGKRLCTEAEWQRACETAAACTWSFAAQCTTASTTTCNTFGNEGALLPTGSSAHASCNADWGAAGRIFDLTGNAKEFTQARASAQNPLRGGAYDTVLGGSTCDFSFTVVNDSFKFANTGFRCCSDAPP